MSEWVTNNNVSYHCDLNTDKNFLKNLEHVATCGYVKLYLLLDYTGIIKHEQNKLYGTKKQIQNYIQNFLECKNTASISACIDSPVLTKEIELRKLLLPCQNTNATDRVDFLYQDMWNDRLNKDYYETKCILKNLVDDNSIRYITDKHLLYSFAEKKMKKSFLIYDRGWKIQPDFNTAHILKPVGVNARTGRGIFIVSNNTDFEKIKFIVEKNAKKFNWKYIAQEYIENPELFQGKKFHLRCYILAKSWKRGAWFPRAEIMHAKSAFQNSDYGNADIHDSHYESTGRFIEFQEADFENFSLMQKNLFDILEFLSMNLQAKAYPESKNGYYILAPDIMFDKIGNAWLLEVNTKPGMDFDEEVIKHMEFVDFVSELCNWEMQNSFNEIFPDIMCKTIQNSKECAILQTDSRKSWAVQDKKTAKLFKIILQSKPVEHKSNICFWRFSTCGKFNPSNCAEITLPTIKLTSALKNSRFWFMIGSKVSVCNIIFSKVPDVVRAEVLSQISNSRAKFGYRIICCHIMDKIKIFSQISTPDLPEKLLTQYLGWEYACGIEEHLYKMSFTRLANTDVETIKSLYELTSQEYMKWVGKGDKWTMKYIQDLKKWDEEDLKIKNKERSQFVLLRNTELLGYAGLRKMYGIKGLSVKSGDLQIRIISKPGSGSRILQYFNFRVWALIYKENERSRAFFEKANWKYMGIFNDEYVFLNDL